MHILQATVVAFLSIIHVVHGAISTECLDSYTNLTATPEMDEALANVLVESLKLADIGGDTPVITTVIDYSKAAGSTYELLDTRCTELAAHTICTTTTNTSSGSFFVQEMNKPVCVPDSCSDEDINLVDPDPICGVSASCFTEAEVLSCAAEKETVTTTCVDDMVSLETQFVKRPIKNARDRYYDVLEGNCVQTLFGQRTRGRCKITVDGTGLNIDDYNVVKDYTKLDDLDMVEYSAECSAKGYKMCELSTIAEDGDVQYYEVGKPFCIPSSCSSANYTDVADLDPFPLCEDCDIVSQEITCPDADEAVDLDTCLADVTDLLSENDFEDAYESVVTLVDASCFDTLHGDNDGTCRFFPKTEAYVNVTGIDPTIHDALIETCIISGMPTCLFTGRASTVYRDAEQNAVETWHFSEFPICIPSECEAEDEDFLAEYLPSLSNDERTVEIDQFVCEQTMAPSISVFPSLSPSGIDSASPSVLSSVSPTITESQSPSVFASSSPSTEASLTPSIEASSVPTTPPVPDETASVSGTNITSVTETIETVISGPSGTEDTESEAEDPSQETTSSAMSRTTSLISTSSLLLWGVWAFFL